VVTATATATEDRHDEDSVRTTRFDGPEKAILRSQAGFVPGNHPPEVI
jgi:hypothetical protein